MKPHRFVLMLSAANLLLLIFAATVVQGALAAPSPVAAQPEFKPGRENWQSATDAAMRPQWDFGRVSPLKRPKPEVEGPKDPPPREYTEAELRAELEEFLARELAVVRIVFAPQSPEQSFATVRAGGAELYVMAFSDFYTGQREAKTRNLPAWLKEVTIGEITADSVTVNAPSRRNPALRFDVRLKLQAGASLKVSSGR